MALTNLEVKFYELASSFFAKANKPQKKVLVTNLRFDIQRTATDTIDKAIETAMIGRNIVDVKVTPLSNELVLYTILYNQKVS